MQRALEFLKRHYEKIILCVVLVALAVVGFMLPRSFEQTRDSIPPVPQAPPHKDVMTPLDTGPLVSAITALTNPPEVTLSGDHNLFNPVVWKRAQNGTLLKILKTGADALIVSNIVNLYQRIGLDRTSADGFFIFHQAQSGKSSSEFVKVNEKPKSGLFVVRDSKGSPDDLANFQLQLEILDSGNKVWITKDRPFERVDGHVADLHYPPEPSLNLSKKHVNDTFTLDGDMYKIVGITNNSVTVQQAATTKQTTIPWKGTPGASPRP